MAYSGGAQNAIYWMMQDLEPEYLQVLARVRDGIQPFAQNQFAIAYLISLECVRADLKKQQLSITEKGKDALEYFGEA